MGLLSSREGQAEPGGIDVAVLRGNGERPLTSFQFQTFRLTFAAMRYLLSNGFGTMG